MDDCFDNFVVKAVHNFISSHPGSLLLDSDWVKIQESQLKQLLVEENDYLYMKSEYYFGENGGFRGTDADIRLYVDKLDAEIQRCWTDQQRRRQHSSSYDRTSDLRLGMFPNMRRRSYIGGFSH